MTIRQTTAGLIFELPDDIVRSDLIDRREKITRLEGWKSRVLHRLDSTNEGMPPNGTTDADMKLLEEIERALLALDHLASARGPDWRERQRKAEQQAASGRGSSCPRG